MIRDKSPVKSIRNFYSKNNRCIDCGKLISNSAKRCSSCKVRGKRNPNFGKKFPKQSKRMKKLWKNIDFRKKMIKIIKKRMKGKNHPSLGKKRLDVSKRMSKNNPMKNPKIAKKVSNTRISLGLAKGKNNPAYIDGRSFELYTLEFNEQLKEFIRKRDNYTCQKCGIKEKDYYRKLDNHHIDYNKRNCQEDNLITLCHNCNTIVNSNRDYYYSYFRYIMEYFICK